MNMSSTRLILLLIISLLAGCTHARSPHSSLELFCHQLVRAIPDRNESKSLWVFSYPELLRSESEKAGVLNDQLEEKLTKPIDWASQEARLSRLKRILAFHAPNLRSFRLFSFHGKNVESPRRSSELLSIRNLNIAVTVRGDPEMVYLEIHLPGVIYIPSTGWLMAEYPDRIRFVSRGGVKEFNLDEAVIP